MNKQTEALKLALEVLEECRRDPRLKYEHPYYDKTITAIRQALAEQPPCKYPHCPYPCPDLPDCRDAEQPAQQQEPVADVGLLEYKGNSVAYIHQKMKAYRSGIDAAWDAMRAKGFHPDGKTSLADMIAKHTFPPASKPWVGLTNEEKVALCKQFPDHLTFNAIDAIEDKLREKNA